MIPRATRGQAAPTRRRYVAFVLDGRRLVLPAEDVDSVAEPASIIPLPTADPRRLGVFLHRAQLVAAVSSGAHVDQRRPTHCVVLREEGFAIPVDELVGLEVGHDDQIPEGFELFDRASFTQALARPNLACSSKDVS